MKLKVLGLNEIIYEGPALETKDYILSLRISPKYDRIPRNQGTGEDEETRTEVGIINVESLVEALSNTPLMIKRGRTPSQTLRWVIFNYLDSVGEARTQEGYEAIMELLTRYVEKQAGKRVLFEHIESAIEGK